MSVETDTGASLPTLETPYEGFRDPAPLLTSPSSNTCLSYGVVLPHGTWRGERQGRVNPCGECCSLGLFHGSLCVLSVGTLLMLQSKRTPMPWAASQIYWNFMSCPGSSFVRRPNLHWPLRLIANLRKNADVVGTEEGFFFFAPPSVSLAMHSLMCFICRA